MFWLFAWFFLCVLFYNILHVIFLAQALLKFIVVTFTISRQRGLGEIKLKGGNVSVAHPRENIQICVC